MELFKMFKSPCLDEDTGANLGGGGTPTETTEQQTTTQTTDTAGQGGQEQTQQMQIEQPKFKVKFNHEEKELTYDEAVQYAQKGLNYDRIYPEYEKLKGDPARTFVEAQAQKYGMTVEQYFEAVKQSEEQEQLNQLVQQNIPEEYAKEMLENRKFREQYESERKAADEQKRINADYQAFISAYPEVKLEEVPQQVFQKAKAEGIPLKYAYRDYEAEMYKAEIAKYKQKEQTEQANQANAASSTGSAKANGKANQGFISKEVYDQNKGNQKWLNANYDDVLTSMKHWK